MKRILVGHDGSEPAANALRWTCAMAKPLGAEVVVVVAGPEHTHETAVRENWCGPAADAGVQHRILGWRGEAGLALIRAADDEDADLLVVGHRAHGPAFGLGSTAMFVAHFANRPFALVPAEALAERPERLVVGLDGSDGSHAAAEWVARVAPALPATVLAAFVQWPVPDTFREHARPIWSGEELEENWAAPISAAIDDVETSIIEADDPAEGLLELADADERTDAVVIGTRRLGGLRPMRLGGITLNLLHRTVDVAVVVVPRH
jgi:nucleotide-binding universal stress UspA family protein